MDSNILILEKICRLPQGLWLTLLLFIEELSNVILIAPVKLGEDSLVAAGSVVGGEVEKDALAISRSPLIQKANGSSKYENKLKSKS